MKSVFWRNLSWLAITTLLGMAFSFIGGLQVARYLGPAGFGRFALVVGAGGWLISLAQSSGTTSLTILSAQKRQASQLFWPGMAIQMGVGLVAIAVSVPVVWLLSHDAELLLPAVVYGLANLAFLAVAVPVSIYRGLDKMEWGLATPLAGGILVGLLVLVQVWDLGFGMVFGMNALAQFLVLIVVVPWAYKNLVVHGWDQGTFTRLWLVSIPLWGVVFLQSFHWRVGIFAVQALAGNYQLGLYSAASKLIDNLRTIPWFLLMAILPAFARAGQSSSEELSRLLQKALRYILIIAFPLVIGLVVLAPWIISLLYTPAFAPSAQVLRVAALGLIPLFVHWVLLNVMVSLHLEKSLVVLYLFSILLEGLCDVIMVPRWGIAGAAWAYVLGEAGLALFSVMYVSRRFVPIKWNGLWRIAGIGSVMLGLGFLLAPGINPFVWAALLCTLYTVALFLSRVLTRAELLSLVHRPVQI